MRKTKIFRVVTVSIVILVVVSGVVGKLNYGGICSLGTWEILITCPLGFLERSLAARELLSQWPSVILILFSVILLGRIFCAWVCPSALLRRVFGDKVRLIPKRNALLQETTWSSYSAYAILGGVLLASFIFRFPVFCFFCPIGLFFGALYAVMRLFSLDSPSLELVLFPTMLVLELWVLKSWCRSICPLGALLSIIGNFNPFIMPEVRKSKCLTGKGINCQACKRVCPEGIDLDDLSTSLSANSCTKCLECYNRCPAKAIKISLWA